MERRRLAVMPRCNHGRVLSAFFALLLALNARFAHANDVQYVYDELGRLVQATNLTAGQAIEYRYDPAGNIISQNAVSLSTLSTGYVSNPAGTVGSQVTINGTGFSTNPAGNIVTFNGVQATVISATQTQLVVIVPAGATSGPINVQVGATAVSAGAFAVTASGNTPTITALNPAVGSVGTRIAVTGTNLDVTPSNDRVRFNTMLASVPSSNSTTINTSVPTAAGSGKVQVTTPRGVAVSPMDFIVVSSGYSASSIGSTGRFAADGSPATISLPTAGRISVQLFDGFMGPSATSTVGKRTSNAAGQVSSSLSTLCGLRSPLRWSPFMCCFREVNNRDIEIIKPFDRLAGCGCVRSHRRQRIQSRRNISSAAG